MLRRKPALRSTREPATIVMGRALSQSVLFHDTLVASAPPSRSNRPFGPLTERGIMNFKLTSWLLSFALAVLLFGIVSIALFDRMHAAL